MTQFVTVKRFASLLARLDVAEKRISDLEEAIAPIRPITADSVLESHVSATLEVERRASVRAELAGKLEVWM